MNQKSDKRTVVILCAGEGKRLLALGKEIPKAMVKVHNRPVLDYVIDFWSPFAKEYVFVVGYKKEKIIDFVSSKGMKQHFSFVTQDSPRGIAHAVECAKGLIKGDFIVVLGDCICKGAFTFPDIFEQGVGVWETDNEKYIRQSYSIELDGEKISRVVEKPKTLVNRYCGMGYYFFQKKVFDYIKKTPASALRNEVEITDVIQNMVQSGESVYPLFFKGEYLNVTSPEDVELAQKIYPALS